MTTKPDHLPVELWEIGRLIPHKKNAKLHPKEQIETLAKSIDRLGIANPLNVTPEGVIITGHGRRLAALSLGWEKVPVIVRTDLSEIEADALRISDNLTVSTDFDTEMMKTVVEELNTNGFDDMPALGMEAPELTRMTDSFGTSAGDLVFTSDITGAVEAKQAENAAREKEIDSTAAPVSDALGFKRVTIEQSRRVRAFMTYVEGLTSKQGAEALVAFIETQGVA
jgi:hypothetical protein